MLPRGILEEAGRVLEDAHNKLYDHQHLISPQALQPFDDTYHRLHHQSRSLPVDNSINAAKRIKKEADEFKKSVSSEVDKAVARSLQDSLLTQTMPWAVSQF